MRSSLALLTILLIAALSLVSPTGCASCGVDLHGGQALHVVFDHPHPDAPAETDDLAIAPVSQPEIHAVAQVATSGQPAVVGQVLRRSEILVGPTRPAARLSQAEESIPTGLSPLLVDPPPRVA